MFAAPVRRILALDHGAGEHRIELLAVMYVGPCHDERQRDATAVHQQVALAAFFFPDPSGCGPPTPGPAALSSLHHQYFASARRCPASGRTRQGPSSISLQRNPQPPTQGIVCGWHLRCQSAPWAAPSTGSQCAVHRRWLKTPVGQAWAVVPPLVCEHRFCLQLGEGESVAPPAARTHR